MPAGTAFVKFSQPEQAQKCIDASRTGSKVPTAAMNERCIHAIHLYPALQGIVLGGRSLAVSLAVTRQEAQRCSLQWCGREHTVDGCGTVDVGVDVSLSYVVLNPAAWQRVGHGVEVFEHVALTPSHPSYMCTHTHTHTHTHTLSSSINKSEKKSGEGEDKRNLFLAKEGQIYPDSDAAKGLSKADLNKRMKVLASLRSTHASHVQ